MTSGTAWHVLVLAKTPVPGRVKTRLTPDLTSIEAAEVAEAALADTLEAVAACGAPRKVLALDGDPGDWIPPGFELLRQHGATFNDRLANAWAEAAGPGLQIGMDTPQVTADLLDRCLDTTAGAAATLGLAEDGGWWALGLAGGWCGDIFAGVVMSTATTGLDQERALGRAGHGVVRLPTLRDIDTTADLAAVAATAPELRVARTWRRLHPEPGP